MRYLIMITIVVISLAGCENAVRTPKTTPEITLVKSANIVTPVSIDPSEVLTTQVEPSLAITVLENVNDHQQMVQVSSNVDMDTSLFEQVIKNSLIISDTDAKFFYTLEWVTPKFLQIYFRLLDEAVCTFMFNLDEARTMDGRTFKNEDQPNRNKVVVFYNVDHPSVTLKDPYSNIKKVIPTWDTRWIKTIKVSGTDSPSFLFYGEGEHHLYDPVKDTVVDIPIIKNEVKGVITNDYGYPGMYSDRFYSGFTYMVLGNKVLYKIDLIHHTRVQLYVFDKPVYGMASSPDGTKIAVLYAHEDTLGPAADLLVLNDKGDIVVSEESAAYSGHSDGFLFVYPLSWEDNSHIVLPVRIEENNPDGKARFDINSKKLTVIKDEQITEQIIEDIFTHERQRDYYLISSIFWSPDGRLAAYRSESNEIWIYNRKERTFEFAGAGTLLGWLPNGELAFVNTQSQILTI